MANKDCKVITFVNQKGGVGKSTYSSCVAYVLAKKGYKVLAIDMDSQASLSSMCNIFPNDFKVEDEQVYGIQDVFEYALECEDNHQSISYEAIIPAINKPTYREAIRVKDGDNFKTGWEFKEFGFDLIPSDTSLADYEQLLAKRKNGGYMLYKVVQVIKENADYDFIIIDCPPALTTLAYSGISAATDGVIVPINLEVLALRGTKNIVVAVAQIQRLMFENNKIVHKGILGLLRSRYVKRYKVQQDFDEIIKDFFPIPAFETIIPSMTSCDKAHAKGWLFAQYDKKAYSVFDELCNELITKEDSLKDLKEPVIIETIGEEAERILETVQETQYE